MQHSQHFTGNVAQFEPTLASQTHTHIYNDIYRHRGIVLEGLGCGFANHSAGLHSHTHTHTTG